jgi:hypothetical protein
MAEPTPVAAIVLAGMNDVINALPCGSSWQPLRYVPTRCSAIGRENGKDAKKIALVLPFIVSMAFLLIADIDTPRHGLIRVSPLNLENLAESLGH